MSFESPLLTSPVMPYALIGYPTLEASLELIQALLTANITRIEIGLPFSDPMADGEILQAANEVAHQQGYTIKDFVKVLLPIKNAHPQVTFTVMSYLNPLISNGLAPTLQNLSTVFKSVVIPDLPLEAYPDVMPSVEASGMALVPLIAPNTPSDRIALYAKYAKDFLYLVTVAGVTGTETGSRETLAPHIAHIRTLTNLPLIAGFGIRTKKDIQALSDLVDGVIIASEIIRLQTLGDTEGIIDLIS